MQIDGIKGYRMTDKESEMYIMCESDRAFQKVVDGLNKIGCTSFTLSEEEIKKRIRMETIFLVTYGEYEDYEVVAAFSTREKAEKWIASYNDNNFANGFVANDYKIEQHIVDDEEIDVDKEVLLYYHFTYRPNHSIRMIGYPYYTFEERTNYIDDTGTFHYWSDKKFVTKKEIIDAYEKIKEG